ncbi:MAG: hypothetical protein LIP23_02790, partial [Planctomycetes bacterium]|nr:hypothetical protein [Planctomycetota bacterium]
VLIDSKLGQELGSSGYADNKRDTFFLVTLKGSEADRAEAIEKLTLDVLRSECDNGFEQQRVESALHSMELASREIRPQYPLRLMERAYASWIYDADPLEQINLSQRLDELRKALAENPKLLENTVRTWLIDNPHRLRLTLVPDKNYIEKLDADTTADIEARLGKMSEAEIEDAKIAAVRLEKEQSESNPPEALATLPRLSIADISPDPIKLEVAAEKVPGQAGSAIDMLDVQVYTGGIGYFNMNLDLSGLDETDLDMLPLLCEAISKSGAAGLDYAAMADREAAATGALEFSTTMRHHVDGDKSRLRLSVWLKALEPDWQKALAILGDRLFAADFADRDRLRDIVLQSRMVWKNEIVPSGHAYAVLHAGAYLSPAMAMSERLGGTSQARMMDALAGKLDGEINSLPDRLVQLRDKMLAGASATVSLAGGGDIAVISRDWLAGNAGKFGGGGKHQALPRIDRPAAAPRIGLAAPSDVAYAAQVMPAPALTDPTAPALLLLGGQLSYGHLWNEVRVKGGAYGIRAAFDGSRRLFTFSSYRDPNVMRTLDIYSGVAAFVEKEMDLSANGLEQAKIGTFKTLDQPIRPSSAVATALARHLGGEDEQFRRLFRKRLLDLDADTVRTAAATVLEQAKSAPTCVIASREKLQDENAKAPEAKRLTIQPLWLGGGTE